MEKIVSSEPFILFLTVGAYFVGKIIYSKWKYPFTHPLFIALVILIPAVLLLRIDYPTYERGSHLITFLLSPTVVALGYALHKQIKYIKGNVVPILTTIMIGAIVSVLVVWGVCEVGGCDGLITLSMSPKSVTMPIALGIAERCGGLLPLTAISVFITGILGASVGPWILDKIGVHDEVARGLAMGASAHGIGTARALECSQLQGAIAGMTIALMGVATAVIIPIFEYMIRIGS